MAPITGGSARCVRRTRPPSAVWAPAGVRTTPAPTIRLGSRRALTSNLNSVKSPERKFRGMRGEQGL